MKKYILFLLFLLSSVMIHAQSITGYVMDEAEKKPLEGAFVYLDGTTISASTDAKGFFELKAPAPINALLVVNYMGFERYMLENPFDLKSPVTVYLKEKHITLNEVVINKKTIFTRKQMLKAFKDNFLGQTLNGSSCEIENEDDIRLSYDTHGNVLLAHAEKPLIITNKKLGYRVVFDLVDFKTYYKMRSVKNIDVNSSFFSGTTAFIDKSGKENVGEKRKKAYLGSPTHFLRTIASDSWEKEGFVLYDDKIPVNSADYFKVTDTLNLKKVQVSFPKHKQPDIMLVSGKPLPKSKSLRNKKLTVLYKGKLQSFITFDRGVFYIDENGLFIPIDEIYFGGYMGVIKAGDMLPADYWPAP